jgi:predicted PolB exonuclease-like 3'-5' exonuclease
LLGLTGLSDEAVAEAMMSQAKEATGQGFVKHHLQQVVAISAVFRHGDNLRVWSLGESTSPEQEVIQRFFGGIEKFTPTLVSWNGCQFDLPVLHYRALYHGIAAPGYWDTGEHDPSFKYNNYLNRYHTRHVDLMDTLAGFTQRAFVRLDEMAVMLGLPGKMGMSGNQVLTYYQQGDIHLIRNYCETDVLNTYLIYVRFLLMKGGISTERYENEIQLTKDVLRQSQASHLLEFLEVWEANNDKILR